jgi:hypothetical protein
VKSLLILPTWVGNAATTPVQLLGAGGSATFSALTCTSLTNSGLTSGRVTYATTGGLLTDSANLTFNGTTLTAAALTSTGVATFSAGTVSAPAITTSGDTNTGIFFPAADTIAFTEGGVESMRIDSSGNVGVGVTPSAWGSGLTALQVKNASIQSNASNSTVYYQNAFFDGANDKYIATNAASAYQQSSGAHIWFSAVSGTAGNNASFSERMRINAGAPILCLAGGSTTATGTGIAFPASQSASSDANTLDDYEEGSWTPDLREGATSRSPTYSQISGSYTKIGRLVCVRWGFILSNKGSGSGSTVLRIYGLPFTSRNITGGYQEPNISVGTGNLNTASNAGIARMYVESNAVHLEGRLANGSDTVWPYSDLTNTSYIIGEVFYEVA